MPRPVIAAALAVLLAACAPYRGPDVPMRTGATSPPPAAYDPASETLFGD